MDAGERGVDPARSYEPITDSDLERLGRVADADLASFFKRNPRLRPWRARVAIVALAQGAADHRLRGGRGIWDFDVIVGFSEAAELPRLFRRQVVSWDWGPSKFGRCPFDPLEYTGRAVDLKYWLIPARDPVESLRAWLTDRARRHPNPFREPDISHEPVILIRPSLGQVVWDPPNVPAPRPKTRGHRRPHGLAPE